MEETTIKLDIGCGDRPQDGYIPVDAKRDSLAHELPYPDESVDEIRASHVLEHYSHLESEMVVRHWHRKLKPGGVLKIAVPDFDWIVDRFRSNEAGAWPLEQYVLGGHTDRWDKHGALFTFDKLVALLRWCGFCNCAPWTDTSGHADCSTLPVSLNVRAMKAPILPPIGDNAVFMLTAPRLGFIEGCASFMGAAGALRIDLMRHHGVFWHQGLTQLMEAGLARGVKWFVTVDYDSVFVPQDVLDMYAAAEMHELDMLCPVQVKREEQSPLVFIRDANGVRKGLTAKEIAGDVIPITSGHFGLTFIRAEMVARMPKPWFLNVPDPNGGWGDGRVDADVHFWNQAQSIGAKCAINPHVKIGHEQRVISWPDRNWQAQHQYYGAYADDGKPPYAR